MVRRGYRSSVICRAQKDLYVLWRCLRFLLVVLPLKPKCRIVLGGRLLSRPFLSDEPRKSRKFRKPPRYDSFTTSIYCSDLYRVFFAAFNNATTNPSFVVRHLSILRALRIAFLPASVTVQNLLTSSIVRRSQVAFGWFPNRSCRLCQHQHRQAIGSIRSVSRPWRILEDFRFSHVRWCRGCRQHWRLPGLSCIERGRIRQRYRAMYHRENVDRFVLHQVDQTIRVLDYFTDSFCVVLGYHFSRERK